MPWFGRRKPETPAPASPVAPPSTPPPPAGHLACSHLACPRQDALECPYVDRRGRSCGTNWCPDHYHLVGQKAYCRRHVAIGRALLSAGDEGSGAPDTQNRAPSLCEWVGHHVEAETLQVLEEVREGAPGTFVSADELSLFTEGTPRVRYWERSWKLSDNQGTLLKLGIRVAEPEDSEVQVLVGREMIEAMVPPWVGNVTDAAARAEFYASVIRIFREGSARYLEANAPALRGRLPNFPPT
jgi:hypothetical protein